MSSNDMKRLSGSDEKPKKRRKKNPYGGDILMQIAAGYANNTLPISRVPKAETFSVAGHSGGPNEPHKEKKKAEPSARGGISGVAVRGGFSGLVGHASRTEVSERNDADGMTGAEKFFASRRLLPVWNARHDILAALERSDVLILTSEAGSGKSTQVPQIIDSASWCTKMIAVTQPRRIAATSLAHRVAAEMGDSLDNKCCAVGYSVRFDTRVSKDTRIKYLTEGRLLREFLVDQSLSRYSAIIVDEVHERSIDVDLIMGFLCLLRDANRRRKDTKIASGNTNNSKMKRPSSQPLRLVLMSATADVEELQKLFGHEARESAAQHADAEQASAPAEAESTEEETPAIPRTTPLDRVELLRVSGRQHPIEIIHEPETVMDYLRTSVEMVLKIHKGELWPGDILVFLPGQDDILLVLKEIKTQAEDLPLNIPRLEVFPLYSQLPKWNQNEALRPLRQQRTRKVILATNIAETSVTVPGVRYVVDSGIAKIMYFDAEANRNVLQKCPISRSAALQRAGRAGREAPGKCFRLYAQDVFDTLDPSDTPEILRVDVADALLTMLASGVEDPHTFPLISKPTKDAIDHGMRQLRALGAIDTNLRVTQDGDIISKMPLPVMHGRALLEAAKGGCLLEAIDILACISINGAIFVDPKHNHQHDNAHRPPAGPKRHTRTDPVAPSDSLSSDEEPKKGGSRPKKKAATESTSETLDSSKDSGNVNEEIANNGLTPNSKTKPTDGADDDESPEVREIMHPKGDLLSYYVILNKMTQERDRKWSSWCKQRNVHVGNLRQALRVRRQLRTMCVGLGLLSDVVTSEKWEHPPFTPLDEEKEDIILKSFLRAFVLNSAVRQVDGSYMTHTGKRVLIHPSSVLSMWRLRRRGPSAILYMEQVETHRNYARVVSSVDPGWIESARSHWD